MKIVTIAVIEEIPNKIYNNALPNYINVNNEEAKNNINFNFNPCCIDFQKNDTIVILKSYSNNIKKNSLENHKRFIVLDPQNNSVVKAAENVNAIVVDCGLSSKATVTVSSIDEKQISVCIQRAILISKEDEVTEQEVVIRRIKGLNTFEHMSIVIANLLYEALKKTEN